MQKSPGEDCIHQEFLIRIGPKAKEILLALFNKIWEASLEPTQWKVAMVIPVLKKGKCPSNFDNYGPIFLTSMLAKLVERIVNTRLTWFLEINNTLENEQAGFMPQRSTNQQVTTLFQHIKDALDVRNTLTAVFTDFKSAYDLAWKENLSLPQGAVTSCSLFDVFINDIAELVQTVTGVEFLLYADDLVLWYSAPKKNAQKRTESALNYALKLLANWCNNNGMVINTSKTAF
nr:RNA directed DNA polymerase from mobile element [Hymenolepis microstoma]